MRELSSNYNKLIDIRRRKHFLNKGLLPKPYSLLWVSPHFTRIATFRNNKKEPQVSEKSCTKSFSLYAAYNAYKEMNDHRRFDIRVCSPALLKLLMR